MGTLLLRHSGTNCACKWHEFLIWSNYCLYSKFLQSEDLYNVNKLPPTISIENFVKFLDKQQNTTWNFAPLSRERCLWEGKRKGECATCILHVTFIYELNSTGSRQQQQQQQEKKVFACRRRLCSFAWPKKKKSFTAFSGPPLKPQRAREGREREGEDDNMRWSAASPSNFFIIVVVAVVATVVIVNDERTEATWNWWPKRHTKQGRRAVREGRGRGAQ